MIQHHIPTQSSAPGVPAGVKFPCAYFGIPTADAARKFREIAENKGAGSHAHVLLEEVSEAIENANDPVRLRAELVQVQAACMRWIEQIDRDKGYGGKSGTVIAVDDLAREARS